jgi:hypothetical protein
MWQSCQGTTVSLPFNKSNKFIVTFNLILHLKLQLHTSTFWCNIVIIWQTFFSYYSKIIIWNWVSSTRPNHMLITTYYMWGATIRVYKVWCYLNILQNKTLCLDTYKSIFQSLVDSQPFAQLFTKSGFTSQHKHNLHSKHQKLQIVQPLTATIWDSWQFRKLVWESWWHA